MTDQQDDSWYIQRINRGDPDAFRELVDRYNARLYALLRMMIRDKFGAEEVLQDSFLRAFNNLDKYDQNLPFYPWLATLSTRLAINWINRSGAKLPTQSSDHDSTLLASESPGPFEDLERNEIGSQLWRHVSDLPLGERTAVLLFYKQDMTVNEIATTLDVTPGTVKTSLSRGRAHLKQAITATEDPV